MSKTPTRIQEPTEEMQQKIIRARIAVATQQRRYILCPYCKHKSIAVFEDTRGHVQAKCKNCGDEIVFDVLSMRRLPYPLHFRI